MKVNKDLKDRVANHILPTSSNLLALCFLLLSFTKVNGASSETLLDECLVAPILLFFLASILSYQSLRSVKNAVVYESWADKVFMIGLIVIAVISLISIFYGL